MGRGIFVIGTDTDVGKTFVTAGLTYKLKESGYDVIAFKPIQSGGVLDSDNKTLIPLDAKFIKDICDLNNEYYEMNSYCLRTEVSPHLAAKIENIKIIKEKIIKQYKGLINKYDYVIVEGAGGIVVPLIDDSYFVYDLIKDLNLDVIVVSRAGVGTINHTILTNEFLNKKNINVKGLVINKCKGEFYEEDNIKVICKLTNLEIIHKFKKIENMNFNNIRKEYKKINLESILRLFN